MPRAPQAAGRAVGVGLGERNARTAKQPQGPERSRHKFRGNRPRQTTKKFASCREKRGETCKSICATRDHEKISGPKGWRNQRIVTSKIFDDLIGRSFESNKQLLSARVSYRSRGNLQLGLVELAMPTQAIRHGGNQERPARAGPRTDEFRHRHCAVQHPQSFQFARHCTSSRKVLPV